MYRPLLLSLVYVSLLGSVLPTRATNHYGFRSLSEQEQEHLEHHTHKVIHVKPNAIGMSRISAHLQGSPMEVEPLLEIALSCEEVQMAQVSHQEAIELFSSTAPLPPRVDNSQLPSFPPIGNQHNLGSCVGWGSTYYQASHEIGLLNGVNNKTNSAGILSPKWTYNLLDDGSNHGLSPLEAYSLLSVNGAISIEKLPYDDNYTSWDLNTTDWIEAASNRMAPMVLIPGLGGHGEQNLTAIKQALSNGHVLTFATFIDSWQFTQIKPDPERINNLHVGEWACHFVQGSNGGHFMTIVGYDDTLWIDVNQNDHVDPGERGAFLIANSWGTSWGNRGFIWISYDAFRSLSAVPSGPNQNRIPAGAALNSQVIFAVPKAPRYEPQLIGLFSLSQSRRNELNIRFGVSDLEHTEPTTQLVVPALANQGGAYRFDGTNSSIPTNATFAVDLTDLISPSKQRCYLICADTAPGNPTQLTTFSLQDLTHNRTVEMGGLPQSFDRAMTLSYLDYHFTSQDPLSITITNPSDSMTLQGTVSMSVKGTSSMGISSVQLYCDSKLLSTSTQLTHTFSVDTTLLTNGPHAFKAVITDPSHRTAQDSKRWTIQNPSSRPSIHVHAGESSVTSDGHTWGKDTAYLIRGASRLLYNAAFKNHPIYKAMRCGNMLYRFALPNGSYLITLKFMEPECTKPKQRLFNVSINDSTVLSQLDLYTMAGKNTSYERSFPVTVTNGQIQIAFTSLSRSALINAISIVPNE